MPTLCDTSLVYTATAGSLFPHTPSHTDEYQGELGDCYFISALGTLADSNPAAVENMFINNGDGTYTVRFYTGTYGTIYNYSDGSISAGFTNNQITADYVTVDTHVAGRHQRHAGLRRLRRQLYQPANALWIPLAEKAYAQWNQTGKEGRDGTNAYRSIQGGWMATVDAQVLGYNATDYIMTTTSEQVAVSALAAQRGGDHRHQLVVGHRSTACTRDHAYAITGYNASSDTFTLYNPWGIDQPGQLTWAQLQAACTQFAVAVTSGTVPISGPAGKAAAKGFLLAGVRRRHSRRPVGPPTVPGDVLPRRPCAGRRLRQRGLCRDRRLA